MVKIFQREFDRNEERLEERAAIGLHLRAIAAYTRKNYKRAQELAKLYEERFGEEFAIFDYTKGGKVDVP